METDTQPKKRPIWEKKISNVKVQLWKNKNVKGSIFISASVHFYRFPFKYYKKVDIKHSELIAIGDIIKEMPEIKVEKKKKK